ncbi:hypothetical protein RIF29_08288 [Crotalaria pallida]|uniref:non-specific serine/threonine protein kinase n=1 Tax=Crotalaria pallida TaxID=3830 RepID=A0AAN9J5L1_CROPI
MLLDLGVMGRQGRIEFKVEIELLSGVHHKNLVSLVGFWFEQEEQILVYEYVPNGTLKDTIMGTNKHPPCHIGLNSQQLSEKSDVCSFICSSNVGSGLISARRPIERG